MVYLPDRRRLSSFVVKTCSGPIHLQSPLLDEDRYLLELDFDDLGDGAAASWQMWTSEMEAQGPLAWKVLTNLLVIPFPLLPLL